MDRYEFLSHARKWVHKDAAACRMVKPAAPGLPDFVGTKALTGILAHDNID